MLQRIGIVSALVVLVSTGLAVVAPLASATTTYGPGSASYEAYYANPSNQSTWSAFCSGAGDGASFSGVQALGVPACGPTPSDDSVGIDIGSAGQGGPTEYGYQCVELAERYLWVKLGWTPINLSMGLR